MGTAEMDDWWECRVQRCFGSDWAFGKKNKNENPQIGYPNFEITVVIFFSFLF